jgi:hypothetical protein
VVAGGPGPDRFQIRQAHIASGVSPDTRCSHTMSHLVLWLEGLHAGLPMLLLTVSVSSFGTLQLPSSIEDLSPELARASKKG